MSVEDNSAAGTFRLHKLHSGIGLPGDKLSCEGAGAGQSHIFYDIL